MPNQSIPGTDRGKSQLKTNTINFAMLETGRTMKSVSIQERAPTTGRIYEQTFPNFFKDRRFSSAVESVNQDRSNISMLEAYETR